MHKMLYVICIDVKYKYLMINIINTNFVNLSSTTMYCYNSYEYMIDKMFTLKLFS